MKHIGNAGCLLKYNNLMLLVKDKKSNKWCLPGGKPEMGETADQTAVRETKEETGLDVRIEKLVYFLPDNGGFYLYHCTFLNPEEIDTTKLLMVPLPVLNEISAIQFLDPHSLAQEEVRFPDFFPTLKRIFDIAPNDTF